MTLSPEQIVERGLGHARGDGAVVLVHDASAVNLRFANTSLTTNGAEEQRRVSVVAVAGGAVGVVSRSGLSDDRDVADLVAAAEAVARANPPAEDAAPLADGPADPGFADAAPGTGIEVFAGLVDGLAAAFDRVRGADRGLFGFARHEVVTSYLGSSTGLRRRHVQPTGTLELTCRAGDGAASAWAGRASRDFRDVDVTGLVDEVGRRLDWSARRVELPAGRYETLLPPSAVADLVTYLYLSMSARAAHDGRSPLSRAGGGTRVGEALTGLPLSLRSDPVEAGLECSPFVETPVSSELGSVFDNGLAVARSDWIRDGRIEALVSTRHSATLTGLPVRPYVDNLVLDVADPGSDLAGMIGSTGRGLLLTCLWYIREVDPETLLLTGLTRDGVFLVEGGEVVGAVNNFRFNESPITLLGRLAEVGPTAPTLSREFNEYLTRVAAPPVRIADFHMSSVSQAS
ncbi:MAG TPA: metallopeptidase TldD-related protein [Mycobacteriales bacterium]|nr:metallopeptidase TldD-related protein [Mycobacteriales bacterium]